MCLASSSEKAGLGDAGDHGRLLIRSRSPARSSPPRSGAKDVAVFLAVVGHVREICLFRGPCRIQLDGGRAQRDLAGRC